MNEQEERKQANTEVKDAKNQGQEEETGQC